MRATQQLAMQLGRQPTLEELEKETGLNPEKIEKVRDISAETPFSLDRPVGDDDGRKFVDFLADDNIQSAFDKIAEEQWSCEIGRLLESLNPIESDIIRWRFGLNNEDELTLKEIGERYNLSRERIRQLQEQAIGKMRRQVREH